MRGALASQLLDEQCVSPPMEIAQEMLADAYVNHDDVRVGVGINPIVTPQCSSTALYQVSYHIQSLFF
jgi:hypothetical protein